MAKDDIITMRITYTAPGQEPVIFESTSDMGVTLLNGVRGLGIAPVEHRTASRVQNHGSVLRSTRLQEREVFLPLLIDAPTLQELDALRDNLVERIQPLNGGGELAVTRVLDGQTRRIPAIYKEGLEGEYGGDYYGDWQTFGLTFLCTEAFWSGAEVTAKWALKNNGKPFISKKTPFFPVILGRSTTDSAVEVRIPGDVNTYPTWEIHGPATDITITCANTGRKISLRGEVRAGETITIDSANNLLSGSRKTQDELWDALSLDSEIFDLAPGTARIAVTASGMTEESSINVSYAPRYLTGY